MRSRHDAPRAFRAHDDFLPYMTARNYIHGGYKSCSWNDEDRNLVAWIKWAVVAAMGVLGYVFL